MDQGTEQWLKARAGLVTASRISDVMAKGTGATRATYRGQIVAERLTGNPAQSFTNAAMDWGTETEPLARSAYELLHGVMVDQVGIIHHPEIIYSGASPDGLVGDDGLVEIKCPNTQTHIEYAVAGKAPAKYQNQILWQMECTGRNWCDFVSFDPRMPQDMRLFVVRYERDQARIDEIKAEVIKFLLEVDEVISKLNTVFHKE